MPGEFSTVAAQYALGYTSGRAVPYTAPRTTYLTLLTAAPNDATTMATMAEVTTAGMARQPVTWSAESAASPSETHNAAVITFGPFTANMATAAAYCALVSALTGTVGDFLWYWTLDVAKQANVGESIQFAIAALSMTLN